MRLSIILAVIVTIAVFCGREAFAKDHGFLYGTITTDQGDEYTGRIRWDKNEGFWDDLIDATKYDDDRIESRPRNRSRIRIFGLSINTGDEWSWSSSSQLAFGNVESIEPRSRGRATVTLKNGEKVRFEDSGSDIGTGNRGIQVDVEGEGIIDLDWSDLERLKFSPEPDSYQPTDESVQRLFGKVTTESGDEFTGYICWDADEIYSTDILDGEEKGRDREVPFATIEVIEKRSSGSCDVRLKSGRDMKLSGTNDVDDGNRGILIMVAGMGQVKVNWDEFESITFLSAPTGSQMTYDRFDGGHRLMGTVTDESGDSYTGKIVWDNDERYSWEFLNGERDGLDYDIEFGQIASIERRSGRSSLVTLRNGTTLTLRGSNDVDDENKGVFVESDEGNVDELDWDEFEKVTFK